MQVDWTTFVLQIVNFLVLVWILKRFLYRPVRNVLEQRRVAIERTLAQATETGQRATALAAQFESRLADWEQEKSAERARFEADLAAQRTREMQTLEHDLAAERERHAAQEAHRLELLWRELETNALAQAGRFTTALVSRLAGPELEARLVEVFLEDWTKLSQERLDGLRRAAATADARATVVSAHVLPEPHRRRIADALTRGLGHAIPLEFGEDPALLAGLRVSIGPWQVNVNVADELTFFAEASNRVD